MPCNHKKKKSKHHPKIKMAPPQITTLSLSLILILLCGSASAQLRQNYYSNTCPDVENIVFKAVSAKFKQTFVTVPATIRLFFHDCFVSVRNSSQFHSHY